MQFALSLRIGRWLLEISELEEEEPIKAISDMPQPMATETYKPDSIEVPDSLLFGRQGTKT